MKLELVEEYKLTLKQTRNLLECVKDEDKEIVKGIISDLEYSIEWLSTGRRPGNRRGAEQSYDPLTFERNYGDYSNDPGTLIDRKKETRKVILQHDRKHMRDALNLCTRREKLVFILSHVKLLSLQEIADKLSVSKSTIQTTLTRAEKKISKQLDTDMFLRAYHDNW
jgi:positive control factor